MSSINEQLNQLDNTRDARVLRSLLTAILADLTALRGLFSGMLSASSAWDPGSIADGDEAVTEITVTGAALGDFVLVSSSLDVADLALVGQVTAADTVTVQLLNNTGGAVDLAETTIAVRVLPAAAFAAAAALTLTQ